jgi:hypothetical protein
MLVQWTSIPVRLKILKLLIKELSNIMEGEGNDNVGGGEGVDEGDGGSWESDEEDEEWEDVLERSGDDKEEDEVLGDVLKGIHTKVSNRLGLDTDNRHLLLSF